MCRTITKCGIIYKAINMMKPVSVLPKVPGAGGKVEETINL